MVDIPVLFILTATLSVVRSFSTARAYAILTAVRLFFTPLYISCLLLYVRARNRTLRVAYASFSKRLHCRPNKRCSGTGGTQLRGHVCFSTVIVSRNHVFRSNRLSMDKIPNDARRTIAVNVWGGSDKTYGGSKWEDHLGDAERYVD